MTPWEIEATEFGNCNCDYGCPCQFSSLPTHGNCEAMVAMEIRKGHHGSVRLDGLRTAFIAWWPGPVHEGEGKCQRIIDIRADEAQRKALWSILAGEHTAEFKTHFFVYNAMMTEIHDPIFAAIEFECDVEARRGRVFVDGLIDARGEPIRNIVSGEPHRVRIDLPYGFEYEIAEIGNASTKTGGKIQLNLDNSYGQFNELHLNNQGVVRSRRAA